MSSETQATRDEQALEARREAIVRFMLRDNHEVYDALFYMQIDVDALIKANLSLTKDQHRRLDKINHTLGKLLK